MKKMMKMKKTGSRMLAVLMAAVVCLSFAACGSEAESEDPVTTATKTEGTRNPEEENEAEVTTTTEKVEETTTEETTTDRADKTSSGNVISTDWRIDDFGVYYLKGYGTRCYQITKITFLDSLEDMPEDAVDISEAENGSVMLWVVEGKSGTEVYIAGEGGVDANEDCSEMFYDFNSLEEINFNGCFYTQNAKDMSCMFTCTSTSTNATISIDFSGFDTSNVTDMSLMFWLSGVNSLDLTSFDTTNVTDMSFMFCGCESLTELDLSSFNTTNVTDMKCMFQGCESLIELELGSFNTSSVTMMDKMFYECVSLTELDLSSFDTSNVTDMSSMFYKCESLHELDLSSFDTSNVTDMSSMFTNCASMTSLDVSSFNTSSVTDMYSMFRNCSSLTSLDLSNFDLSSVTKNLDWYGLFTGTSLSAESTGLQ